MNEQPDLLAPEKPKRKYTRREQPEIIEQTAVAVKTNTEPAHISDATAMVQLYERMIRDPTIDVGRLRDFGALLNEQRAREAEHNFNNAMAKVQAEIEPVATDANNPQTRSKYASYYALDKAVRAIYTAHGFALSFDTEESAKPDHTLVVCYVTCAGHTRKYRIDMPSDGKGAKGGDVMTKTHATGSAATYGQRYLLKAIFNIAIGGDDDGNAAGTGEKISEEQALELTDLAVDVGADRPKFYEYVSKAWRMEITSMADIPAARFADAKAKLEAKRGKA